MLASGRCLEPEKSDNTDLSLTSTLGFDSGKLEQFRYSVASLKYNSIDDNESCLNQALMKDEMIDKVDSKVALMMFVAPKLSRE